MLSWENKQKKFEGRAKALVGKVKTAREAWQAELKKAKELDEEHKVEEAEHNRVMSVLSTAEAQI